jgi:hypothetical protein
MRCNLSRFDVAAMIPVLYLVIGSRGRRMQADRMDTYTIKGYAVIS